MKRILLLLTGFLLSVGPATAKTTNTADVVSLNYRGYGNSFIFVEDGIEFSVFPDGQFDFYAPSYGPNVSLGINTGPVSFSFNSGYNYDPYVQYDSFGAVIQIENTPVFYDYYGRVSQIGNIFINYNNFGRVSLIGGMHIYYRNRVFSHFTGFINVYNRAYVYRPWHRFYSIPSANFCIVNTIPYRQYYVPIRHVYYRPYVNNYRYSRNFNRNSYSTLGRRSNDSYYNRYAQAPRSSRDRELQRTVERRYANIATSRSQNSRIASADLGRRYNTGSIVNSRVAENSTNSRSTTSRNSRISQERTNSRSSNDRSVIQNNRSNARVATTQRGQSNERTMRSQREVTKSNTTINRNTGRQASKPKSVERSTRSSQNARIAKPSTSNSRTYSNTRSEQSRSSRPTVKQSSQQRSSTTNQRSTHRGSTKSTRSNNGKRSRG